MNLNKLFNKNYAIQNIKKSKGILAIMFIIIPVISLFILYGYRTENTFRLPVEMGIIALPNILGMYVIPFILSNVLMGYVYKQNSLDFVNSMPISRRKAYLTNIITGSIYIFILQAFNLLIQAVFILLTNTYVIFAMLLDISITMLVGYLFVFALCSLALSVSGNKFTQIVVAMLILFFIPFTRIINLICIDYGSINIISANGIKEAYTQYIDTSKTFTIPINVFQSFAYDNGQIYSLKSILFTSLIFLLYIVIGMELFEKRKMENNGFSFYNTKVHLFVKGMTLYPMIYILKLLFFKNSISDFDFEYIPQFLFALAVILIYYLVYDLITNKKIKLLNNIACFLATTIALTVIVSCISFVYDNLNDNINIEASNIEKIAISLETSFYVREDIEKLVVSDKEIINYIFDNSYGNINYNSGKAYNDFNKMTLILFTKSGKRVKIGAYMDNAEYKNLIQRLSNNEEYIKAASNIYITSNYAYYSNETSFYSYINLNEYKELKDLLNDNSEELVSLKLKNVIENSGNNYQQRIVINTYKNHKCYNVSIPLYKSEILNKIIKLQNKAYSDKLKEDIAEKERDYMYGYNIEKNENGKRKVLKNTITELMNGDIYKFIIENKENDVNLAYPYYKIETGKGFVFYTNEIEKFENIIKSKVNLDTDFMDYDEMIEYDDVEYVDTREYVSNDTNQENIEVENSINQNIINNDNANANAIITEN